MLGFAPLIASGVDIVPLQNAVTLFGTGMLVLLVGLMLRKLRKSFE